MYLIFRGRLGIVMVSDEKDLNLNYGKNNGGRLVSSNGCPNGIEKTCLPTSVLTLICSEAKKFISLTVNLTFRRSVLRTRRCRGLNLVAMVSYET